MKRDQFNRSVPAEGSDVDQGFEERKGAGLTWTAYGTVARVCIENALEDYLRSPHDPTHFPIVAFDHPCWLTTRSVGVSMLVLSEDAGDRIEDLEAALRSADPGANEVSDTGFRAIRLAWIIGMDLSRFRSFRLSLHALGFTVFSGPDLSPLDVRAAILGLVSVVWLERLICVDYADIVTILTRRTGMQGIVLKSPCTEADVSMWLNSALTALPSLQGIFSITHVDDSFTMEEWEAVNCGLCGPIESYADCDVKSTFVVRPNGDRLLVGGKPQVWIMMVSSNVNELCGETETVSAISR